MRIRTIYFKSIDPDALAAWWTSLLDAELTKDFPLYKEVTAGEINLGFVGLDHGPYSERSNAVPVFEFDDGEVAGMIEAARAMGAVALLEGEDHPDFPETAAVMIDPFGNEFEFTSLHD